MMVIEMHLTIFYIVFDKTVEDLFMFRFLK